jgi:hypothetical protein
VKTVGCEAKVGFEMRAGRVGGVAPLVQQAPERVPGFRGIRGVVDHSGEFAQRRVEIVESQTHGGQHESQAPVVGVARQIGLAVRERLPKP